MKHSTSISAEKRDFLQDHLAHLREILSERDSYHFPIDISVRMAQRGLNASQLAELCNITPPVVRNWTGGKARPRGKEQIKTLGLALGMGLDELNLFLLRNAYPRLTGKNPLDSICTVMLKRQGGDVQNAARYRDEVQASLLRHHNLARHTESVATAYLSESLLRLDSEAELNGWLDEHTGQFTANDKMMLPSRDLQRLVRLYQGAAPVSAMENEGGMPPGVPNQLYAILNRQPQPFPVRGMRRKLIVFGLYNNIATPDLDVMLELAGVLPISQAATVTDAAILTAMNNGHECYPYYEFDALYQLHCDVVDVLLRYEFSNTKPPELYKRMQEAWQKRLGVLNGCVLYYDDHRSEHEKRFEALYTDCLDDSNGCLLDYVRDVLILLAEEHALPEQEVGEWLKLMRPGL